MHLNGRRFTWSSERDNPTLELLDRVFASEDWMVAHPNHYLCSLASECSDHAPLRLTTASPLFCFKRLHFENIWPQFDGYLQTVEEAWSCPWQNVDIFRELDYKFRNTAKALQSWSAKHIGSVLLTQKSTLKSEGKCSPNTEKSTKRASQFDLKLTRKKIKSNSRAYGIPNISQMGVSAIFADTIDDKKILNASA